MNFYKHKIHKIKKMYNLFQNRKLLKITKPIKYHIKPIHKLI